MHPTLTPTLQIDVVPAKGTDPIPFEQGSTNPVMTPRVSVPRSAPSFDIDNPNHPCPPSHLRVTDVVQAAQQRVEQHVPLASVTHHPLDSIRTLTEVRIGALFEMLDAARVFDAHQRGGWDSTTRVARRALSLRLLGGFLATCRAGDVFLRVKKDHDSCWPREHRVRLGEWSCLSVVGVVDAAATALRRLVNACWVEVADEAVLCGTSVDRDALALGDRHIQRWLAQSAAGLMQRCAVYREVGASLIEDRAYLRGVLEQEFQAAMDGQALRGVIDWQDTHYALSFGAESATVKASKGMRAIEALIIHQGRPLSAEQIERYMPGAAQRGIPIGELMESFDGYGFQETGGSVTPVMDGQAIDEVNRLLSDLEESLEGGALDDTTREALRDERQRLEDMIAQATGLGGRLRGLGTHDATLCRDRVRKAIRDAVKALAVSMPQLAAHLEQAGVARSNAGSFCYTPDTPDTSDAGVEWEWA